MLLSDLKPKGRSFQEIRPIKLKAPSSNLAVPVQEGSTSLLDASDLADLNVSFFLLVTPHRP